MIARHTIRFRDPLARRPRGLTPREAAGAEWGRPQPRERQREHRTGVGAPEADAYIGPNAWPVRLVQCYRDLHRCRVRRDYRPDQLVAATAARLILCIV